jgi:fatty-acyl-CoA synthase
MAPSYAHGAAAAPLLGETIGENLDRTIARFGDRDALISVHQDVRYTYAELGEAVNRLARGLLAAGIAHPETMRRTSSLKHSPSIPVA